MSDTLNPRHPGTLASNIVYNPKNNSHFHAITTRSAKTPMDSLMSTLNESKNKADPITIERAPNVEEDRSLYVENNYMDENGKGMVKDLILKTIPRPRAPYSQILKKNHKKRKYQKFLSMLKELSVIIPLVEELDQIPGYTKFMKDLVIRK